MAASLVPGAPAPWFFARELDGNPRYAFDTAAGRPVLLLFLGSAAWPAAREALALVARHRALFDDVHASLFGVSIDPEDASARRIARHLPGIRWFLDHDGAVSRLYRALEADGTRYRPHWLLLDRALRVVRRAPIDGGAEIMATLRSMAAAPAPPLPAPILTVPGLLDRDLCRRLIAHYETSGGRPSGFMQERGGRTVEAHNPNHKRRADATITDAGLLAELKQRLSHVLRPLVRRAFQFDASRIERWLVACYDDADGGGHFRAHRDDTTKGTAHRRFACTINLNAEDYDGGDLHFPEFNDRSHRAPTGGAVIFSCSLLHEVRPVTRGRRYAFLPFLYDEPAAQQREANAGFLDPEIGGYRAQAG